MPPLSPASDAVDFATERRTMVDRQVRTFDVTDQPIIARMLEIPREIFLPHGLAAIAYSDKSLAVAEEDGDKRILLPPMVLARLLQSAAIRPSDRVLDIAGGGGYGAAIAAGLAREAVAVESFPALTARAQSGFKQLGIGNASALDGSLIDPSGAAGAFDVILVNGAIETGLDPLLARLADGGRLIAVERRNGDSAALSGQAVCWLKSGSDIGRKPLFNVAAPLLKAFARSHAFTF